ncbi:MAG: PorT family protein [Saprospirales bacterium]|nr:PorT family protein [Saprospirales bacterium]
MKTRLFYFVLPFMLSASLASAQSTDMDRTSFAVLGGVNFQNLNGKDSDGGKLENDLIIGFHAGVNAQIPIAPGFFFQPGLLFSTKGAKATNSLFTTNYKLSYVELPLNLVYKGLLGDGAIMIGFGPYVAYGIGGKTITEGGAVKVETDVEFQNEVEILDPIAVTYIRPLDAGGNIFVGYEMASGLFIQLNTQLGMLKVNPEDKRVPGDQSIVKHTGFGASAGFRF